MHNKKMNDDKYSVYVQSTKFRVHLSMKNVLHLYSKEIALSSTYIIIIISQLKWASFQCWLDWASAVEGHHRLGWILCDHHLHQLAVDVVECLSGSMKQILSGIPRSH